jgi:hypothetical protein
LFINSYLNENAKSNGVKNRYNSLACSADWLDKIGGEELSYALDTNNQLLKCLPRCERQSETPTFTVSVFPPQAIFSQNADFCLALLKVSRICKNPNKAKVFELAPEQAGITCEEILNASKIFELCEKQGKLTPEMVQSNSNISKFIYSYAKNNFAILRVFIKDPYYTRIKCDEQISLISFLGNAGGLFGLCLGLSLVSIFEIFYHFVNFCSAKMFQK